MNKKLNFYKVKILIDIYNSDVFKTKNLSLSKIARSININRNHPYFREILDELTENQILEQIEEIGRNKIVSINKKKLEKLIDQQEITKFFHNYFDILLI
ncbi:MAG: hypothetical protein ACOCV1_00045 [Bacillota bacterium]